MLPAAKQVLLIIGPVMGCLHNKICRCYPLTWIWSCVKMGFVHDICVVVRLLRQGRVFHPSGWTAQCRGGHLVPGRSGAVRTRGVVSGLPGGVRLDYLAGKREIHSDIVLGLKYRHGSKPRQAELQNVRKL